ncbi:MAG: NADAR family protein [Bacteroidota bacterium]
MQEQFTFFWKSASPFSNWHPAEFEIDGLLFNCAEQYMMYGKAVLFGDKEMAVKILEADSPGRQKSLGRKVRNFDANIWNKQCKQIVYDANYAKFTQNENLLKYLLKTKGTTLVEASPVDNIWGIGLSEDNPKAQNRSTWRGKNWLGEVLTKLREDLIEEDNAKRK